MKQTGIQHFLYGLLSSNVKGKIKKSSNPIIISQGFPTYLKKEKSGTVLKISKQNYYQPHICGQYSLFSPLYLSLSFFY